jgi:hypothetical protein
MYRVQGYPSVVQLGKNARLVARDARGNISNDPDGMVRKKSLSRPYVALNPILPHCSVLSLEVDNHTCT